MLNTIRKCIGLILIIPGLVLFALGFAIVDLDMGGRLLEAIGDFIVEEKGEWKYDRR